MLGLVKQKTTRVRYYNNVFGMILRTRKLKLHSRGHAPTGQTKSLHSGDMPPKRIKTLGRTRPFCPRRGAMSGSRNHETLRDASFKVGSNDVLPNNKTYTKHQTHQNVQIT